jgi:hypothetical protein
MGNAGILEQVIARMEADPHGAASLTLYALANTLDYPKAGYLFKLDKLKGLDPESRQLAYGLMEMMANGEVGNAPWQAARERMDALVRDG